MAWIMVGDQLTNTDFPEIPGKPFVGDSPYTMWRIDPNANDGMPYLGLMIGLPVFAPEPPVLLHDLYFGSILPERLFYGDTEITDAYWSSKKVY